MSREPTERSIYYARRNKVILDEVLRGGTYTEVSERASLVLCHIITPSMVGNVVRRLMKKNGSVPGRKFGVHNARRKIAPHRSRILELYQQGLSRRQIHKTMTAEGWDIKTSLIYDCIRQYTKGVYNTLPHTTGHEEIAPMPKKDQIKRYILTSAQNNTAVDPCMKANIETLAKYYDARILVGKFVYRVGSKNSEVPQEFRYPKDGDSKWDPWVEEHACNDNLVLSHDLIWEGGLNCMPTADNPLSGFDGHGRGRSLIFPHAKQEMKTIARHRDDRYTRYNYTTGCITVPKYVKRKAGMKAHFHHVQGALLVEVNHLGDWWVRQLNDCDGVLHDLGLRIENGEVTKHNKVPGVTLGDLHLDDVDEDALNAITKKGGLLRSLRPEVVFFHDALEFRRSHHDRKSPIQTLISYVNRKYVVEEGIEQVCKFLASWTRFTKVVVVNSNHDRHLAEWLENSDPRTDPANLAYHRKLDAARMEHITKHGKDCNILELAAGQMPHIKGLDKVLFLGEDESYVCEKIECGMHGDRGPNGSRGSPQNHTGLGSRVNIGHSHSPGIRMGVYVAGTTGNMQPGYAKGPTSWSQGHIVIYPGGKRAILCMRAGKLWAEQKVRK